MAASSENGFHCLDDGGRLLGQISENISEAEAYYSALACEPFHRAIRDRFPNGTRTTPSSVLSAARGSYGRTLSCQRRRGHHGGELICVDRLLQLGN